MLLVNIDIYKVRRIFVQLSSLDTVISSLVIHVGISAVRKCSKRLIGVILLNSKILYLHFVNYDVHLIRLFDQEVGD